MNTQEENNQAPQEQDEQHMAELTNELRELGHKLEQAARAAINSDMARTMQRDIASGLHQIGSQLQSALQALHENEELQKLGQRGQQAVSQMQDHRFVKDFQDSLAKGVAQLNEQLASFVERMQQHSHESEHHDPPVETIPIETAGEAATGETRRIDPDSQ